MNFDPSILLKIAAGLTVIGTIAGTYALFREYLERRFEPLSEHTEKLIQRHGSPPTVRSTTSITVGEREIDTSRMVHRI